MQHSARESCRSSFQFKQYIKSFRHSLFFLGIRYIHIKSMTFPSLSQRRRIINSCPFHFFASKLLPIFHSILLSLPGICFDLHENINVIPIRANFSPRDFHMHEINQFHIPFTQVGYVSCRICQFLHNNIEFFAICFVKKT